MAIAYLDTSAVAKWYLNEHNSDLLAKYIQEVDIAAISSLTRTELRSLLARRRRLKQISAAHEAVALATFEHDISVGHLQMHPVNDPIFQEAANLIGRFPEYSIRTLDALQLSIAQTCGVHEFATADAALAKAANAVGLPTVVF
jgi:uncharacterized protein